MTLSSLLQDVVVVKMFQTLYGRMVVTHDVQINKIQYDSRNVGQHDLFVAIRGTGSDGHQYISQAVGNGAKVVVVEDDASLPDSFFMHAGVVKVVVPNTRVALARISANYYGRPAEGLAVVGVTGTNGKTTSTHLIRAILEEQGHLAGLIGTIEYRIGTTAYPAPHTTPESLELQKLLREMVDRRCTSVVMEVSSHALDQHRVDGIGFRVGVFTNLTQDHLDYHGTMEVYGAAKQLLFSGLSSDAVAVTNADDPWGERMIASTKARTISYGLHPNASVRAADISLSMTGTTCAVLHEFGQTTVSTSLIGMFNVSNILAAFATGLAFGIPADRIRSALESAPSVKGRFEQITSPQGWTAVVDYAHTPDALLKVLGAVHEIFERSGRGRIITVFGCGGNRDKAKRPLMAAIATQQSDVTILTSDNPRNEDPNAILDDVEKGVQPGATVLREPDRGRAVVKALSMAAPGDVVILAGKGHEEVQIVGSERIHFSDQEAVNAYIRSHA